MKRALLLLAALLGALAVLWLVERREAPAGIEGQPPADLRSETAGDRVEFIPPGSEPRSRWSASEPDAREPTPDKPPAKTSRVRLVVAFAESRKPIGPSLANLFYTAPRRGDDAPSPDVRRMAPEGEGRFGVDVPEGARLTQATVCGVPQMLDGPRTEHNEASRYTPLFAPLDQLVGDEPLEIRLEVVPGREISGLVLDLRSRRPIAEAKVNMQTVVGRSLRLRSDRDGRFRFGDPGGNPRMRIEADGYCRLERGLDPETLATGEVLVLLDPVLHVAGRVVDANGSPVSGIGVHLTVRLVAREAAGRPSNLNCHADTDENGHFRFVDVPPCEDAVLTCGHGVPRRELGPIHEDLDGVLLVGEDSVPITVELVRLDGSPVEPDSVTLVWEEGSRSGQAFLGRSWSSPKLGMFIPAGKDVQLIAIAPAGPEDANRMLVGRQKVAASTNMDESRVVRITLSEPLDYRPPPSDLQVIEDREREMQATLDLRLLERSGSPLPNDTKVALEISAEGFVALHPTDGWVRLRHPCGTFPVRIRLGEETESFDIAIPWQGYGRIERRLRIGR